MLLRKLTAAFAPLVVCLAVLAVYRLLDGFLSAENFFSLFIKGALLGLTLALVLPAAGLRYRTIGLTLWLYIGAGVLGLLLVYQALQSFQVIRLHIPLLLLDKNPMVTLVESAVMTYMLLTAVFGRSPAAPSDTSAS